MCHEKLVRTVPFESVKQHLLACNPDFFVHQSESVFAVSWAILGPSIVPQNHMQSSFVPMHARGYPPAVSMMGYSASMPFGVPPVSAVAQVPMGSTVVAATPAVRPTQSIPAPQRKPHVVKHTMRPPGVTEDGDASDAIMALSEAAATSV